MKLSFRSVLAGVAGIVLLWTTPAIGQITEGTPGEEPSVGIGAEPESVSESEEGNGLLSEPCLYGGVDCGCPVCCYQPLWYAEVGALFLNRDRARRFKLIEDQNDSTGEPDPRPGHRREIVSSAVLDFDYETGPQLVIGRYLDDCRRVEVRYFGLHHWRTGFGIDSTAVPPANPNLSLPFDSNYTNDFDGALHVDVSYKSELHNVEVNLLDDRHSCFTRLIGFRYLNLNEDFDYESTDAAGSIPSTSNYLIGTDNHLVGFQIGGIVEREVCERFCVDLTGKLGAYVNFAEQSTFLGDRFDNENVRRDFRERQGELAFIGELRFGCAYQLTKSMAAIAGYQLMWVEGVALAPEQLDLTTTPLSGSGLNDNGGVFYDGAYVGIRVVR
ncbi:MAG TPA: BBP7 family outer membrane beta-barrel protein [Thermoguttaceae bacterium]|nr:BBP7 family outer membrane beta-barrel protein [Thermoguttaceae bacterium]